MIDEKTIREIADRQAITEQLYRYCRSMDRRDVQLIDGLAATLRAQLEGIKAEQVERGHAAPEAKGQAR